MEIEESGLESGAPFNIITWGGVFKYEGEYYMRLKGETHEAVRLNDGCVVTFLEDTLVRKVECRLVVGS